MCTVTLAQGAPAAQPSDPETQRPRVPRAALATGPAAEAFRDGEPMDVNLAGVAELQLLPGVGPALAARIIDYRQEHGAFRALADLDRVKGIGPGLIARLTPHVRVDGALLKPHVRLEEVEDPTHPQVQPQQGPGTRITEEHTRPGI